MMPKRAFLVLGAESSGTHMLTDLLISAGCAGHSGDHTDWLIDKTHLADSPNLPWKSKLPTDQQPWDTKIPFDQNQIVWRLSAPHGGEWPQIRDIAEQLRANGYLPQAVVIVRDQYPTIQSQLKWHHKNNYPDAQQSIQLAYTHIFKELAEGDVSYSVTTFESLTGEPKAAERLLEQLELKVPADYDFSKIKDANSKWFQADSLEPQIDFDERRFPCTIESTQQYYKHVRLGNECMANSRVTICGLAHNVADSLGVLISSIEELGGSFADYRVILFENNSLDGTKRILSNWASRNDKVTILCESLTRPKWQSTQDIDRMHYMAECRNFYLDQVLRLDSASDYVVVLDTDLSMGFSYEGIANSLGHNDWDVIGSNGLMFIPEQGEAMGKRIFYDAWAFRELDDDDHVDIDSVNKIRLHRGESLLRVNSCFGGLALYRWGAFTCGARYQGDTCEHVGFHRQLRHHGYDRVFLNPSQIVLYNQ